MSARQSASDTAHPATTGAPSDAVADVAADVASNGTLPADSNASVSQPSGSSSGATDDSVNTPAPLVANANPDVSSDRPADSPRASATSDASTSAQPPLTRPIPDDYAPPVEPPSRPRMTVSRRGELDLSFDDLEFPIEPDQDFERSMLTEKIEGYDGKPVTIRGFILPGSMFQQTGSKEFVLVRDNQQCCFGPTAYVYHNIQIKMAPGHTADFTIRPITVTGKFTIEPWIAPNGKCYSVFQMVATSAK